MSIAAYVCIVWGSFTWGKVDMSAMQDTPLSLTLSSSRPGIPISKPTQPGKRNRRSLHYARCFVSGHDLSRATHKTKRSGEICGFFPVPQDGLEPRNHTAVLDPNGRRWPLSRFLTDGHPFSRKPGTRRLGGLHCQDKMPLDLAL